jgi:predicted dinucleotide-binding enzyme
VSHTELETDVLVLGEDREAVDMVRALADAVSGMRGVYGGACATLTRWRR